VNGGAEVTPRQIDYVRALQKDLHLPSRMLDDHCTRRFGCPFAGVDRRRCSDLIDELKRWTELPVEMRVAMGERQLPGFGW
jgi:hypothetical protein